MDPVCSVNDADCVQGRLKRGLCGKHYTRLIRTGTTSSPFIDNWSRFTLGDQGCWLWQGSIYWNGYGQLSRVFRGTQLAHRAFYIRQHGPLPRGTDLDHLCRVRSCVNPDHLEPVTRAENLKRGHQARTHCRTGRHDITVPGAIKNGQCVECWRLRYRAAGARYRAKLRNDVHSRSPGHSDS